ncbi:class I adenylate-forming enzyme family protein [Bdellovibrio reynosensis]|uniref:Acyl--CoA ligase n=1 Tax=Bdellovibrio reynosensis TaxID=2835041 RepID=A0ABY4CBC8_9BACT|nr:class I adenylate-forming enzyme family protein [Bdellovibrio reynosensis]UOF02247.1 acyl--CoA ligase [Bdellovibrio reynosensis]
MINQFFRFVEENFNLPLLITSNGTITYGQLLLKAKVKAEGLDQYKKCRIGIFADDIESFWASFFACWLSDNIPVPIPKGSDNDYQSHILKSAGLVGYFKNHNFVLISNETHIGEVDAILNTYNVGAILFTSGSTGKPKGVVLGKDALLVNAYSTKDKLNIPNGSKILIPVPFHFVSAISHFFVCALSRATIHFNDACSFPQTFLGLIEEYKISGVGGSPIHAKWLVESGYHLKGINWLMSSGDKLGPSITEKIISETYEFQLFQVYGLTEVGGRVCIANRSELKVNSNTIGHSISCLSAKVDNHDGGNEGSLLVKGESLMLGYLDNLKNGEVLSSESYFNTGDQAKVSDNGFEILGRNDDVFKVSGIKVSGPMVSDIAMSSGMLKDAWVSPMVHPLLGTVPCLLFTPKAENFDLIKLKQFLTGKLYPQARPRAFKCLENIPRTGSGKVIRREVQAIVSELTI